MAPPIDADKIKASMKNPWATSMLGKDLELLKLKKRQNEEREWVHMEKAKLWDTLTPRAGDLRKLAACCRRYWVYYCALST